MSIKSYSCKNELFICFMGTTKSNDICLKTDLKDVKKKPFEVFLKRFLNEKEVNEGIESY